MTLLEHALRYGELGLRIFPIAPGTKKPLVSKWPEIASSDTEQIREWWTRTPDAGIGLACGDELPGGGRFLFVLDLDRHEGGADGIEAWKDLVREHGFTATAPEVLTPTGGAHLYFTAPTPLTNSRGTLPDGIDVRGAGGFVILPPSIHPNGSAYEHEVEHELGHVRIPKAPERLLRLLAPPETTNVPETSTRTVSQTPDIWAELDDRPGTVWADSTTWSELLLRDGWIHLGTGGSGEDQWCRPGKNPKDGPSATTNYGGADRLVVHSTNAPIPPDSYSKLGYLSEAHFGGDYSAASSSLKTTTPTPSSPDPDPDPVPIGEIIWETPTPITVDTDPQPFPTYVLPDWIRRQVEQIATELQVAEDLPAMLALGALSIISAGNAKIRVGGPWTEGVNLYLVVALPPGAGKSPAFKRMLEAPLGTFEQDLDEGGAHDRELAKHFRKAAEKELDKAVNTGNQTDIREAFSKLADHEEQPTPKLFVDDATVEKLVVVMKEQKGRIALVSTEGGVFGMMTGRYSDVTFLDPYLQAWSGDTIRVDRLTRDDVVVRNPTLSIAVTVQPTVLAELSKKPELRGRGLTARFMFSFPLDNVGSRDIGRETTFDDKIDDAYSHELVGLAKTLRDRETPLELVLDDDARERFILWRKDHEAELGAYKSLEHMREWITKAQSSVVRLSALLHLADRAEGSKISLSTMNRAITVGDYWEGHARRVHDLFDASEPLSEAKKFLGLVRSRVEPGETFTLRDSTQWSRSGSFGTVAGVLGPLELLIEKGWLKTVDGGPITYGRGKPGSEFVLNPLAGLVSSGLNSGELSEGLVSTRSQPSQLSHSERSTATDSSELRPLRPLSLRSESETLSLSQNTDTEEAGDNPTKHGLNGLNSIECPI